MFSDYFNMYVVTYTRKGREGKTLVCANSEHAARAGFLHKRKTWCHTPMVTRVSVLQPWTERWVYDSMHGWYIGAPVR